MCAVCIGEQTKREAERCMKTSDERNALQILTAEEASEEGILQTICDHFLQNTKRE